MLRFFEVHAADRGGRVEGLERLLKRSREVARQVREVEERLKQALEFLEKTVEAKMEYLNEVKIIFLMIMNSNG